MLFGSYRVHRGNITPQGSLFHDMSSAFAGSLCVKHMGESKCPCRVIKTCASVSREGIEN